MSLEILDSHAGKKTAVCGGRDYADYAKVTRVLDRLAPAEIIHGAARGADSLAGRYARQNNVPCQEFPAQWNTHSEDCARKGRRGRTCRLAGFNRNQQMLDEAAPQVVIAFPGGNGTKDLVAKTKKAGIPVILIK